MKRNTRIKISVILIFIGICLLSSTYYNSKKHEVFDEMNKLYYEQIGALDEIEEEPIIEIEEPVVEEIIKETTTMATTAETTTKAQTTTLKVDYSKLYIGYIKIPKISLERGFMDINSKYNKVSRNIFVHPSSTFPDQEASNLILASHSGNSSISFFKNLYKLDLNDDVYIKYNQKEYHYKITKIYKEEKDGTVAIRRNKNKTTLTLITCTKNDKTSQTVYICELV